MSVYYMSVTTLFIHIGMMKLVGSSIGLNLQLQTKGYL